MGEFFIASVFLSALIFLFPVYVRAHTYLDVSENKCWFSINLYRFIKVLGGYGQLGKEGVAVHISKKKAIFIPYGGMAETRKKFEITKGFQLLAVHQVVQTGGADSAYGVMLGALLNAAAGSAFSVLQTRHPFLSLKSNTLLTDQTELKVSVESEVVFNGLVLLIAVTKKLIGGLLNWIRIKKSTALWKKRQSV